MNQIDKNKFKLDQEQIDMIIDKIVPLIAAPEDHEFFRGVLAIKAQESTSGEFALLVKRLLDAA